jgi:predicted aldo/keto reductase-like oxidoreductase
LETLGVDRVDVMQIHSSGAIEHDGFGPAMKIHAELVKLRDEGLLKYIGLTTHVAFETVYKMIATGGFDQALLTICYFPKGMSTLLSEQNREFREKCLDKAHDLGMAVVAMKVMGVSIFGRMSRTIVPNYAPVDRAKLPAAAMRWVLSDERVSLAAIGMGYREEIERNAETLSSDLTLTEEDRRLLADYSAKAHESPRIKAMGVDLPSSEELAAKAIKQNDKDRDGRLTRQEFPIGQRKYFDACDRNKDGYASLPELTEAIKRRRGG